jgi:putative transcriptional regulator
MPKPPHATAPPRRAFYWLACCLCLWLTDGWAAEAPATKAMFLVATENLTGSSFQETVILVTHYSRQGATGLAINRPTDIPMREVLPDVPSLQQNDDPLFLGGPVSTNAIFVLLRTSHPHQGMHHIAGEIYFATGENAYHQPLQGMARTYAGYTGWAPGQLEAEIKRGDWLVVKYDPAIIFEEDTAGLWQRLYQMRAGNWI